MSIYNLGYLKHLFHSLRLLSTMVFQYGVLKAMVSMIQKIKRAVRFCEARCMPFANFRSYVDHEGHHHASRKDQLQNRSTSYYHNPFINHTISAIISAIIGGLLRFLYLILKLVGT